MDNEQERNEHFKGFARILIQKVDEKNRAKAQSTGHYLDEEELHLLIAQGAYDLVLHGFVSVPASLQAELGDPDNCVKAVPDMTEWPKMTSQSPAPDE